MQFYLFLPNNGQESSQHIIREHSKQIGKSGNRPNTIHNSSQNTAYSGTHHDHTCVSFTSTAKETIRKAFKRVKQHPETSKNTVASQRHSVYGTAS